MDISRRFSLIDEQNILLYVAFQQDFQNKDEIGQSHETESTTSQLVSNENWQQNQVFFLCHQRERSFIVCLDTMLSVVTGAALNWTFKAWKMLQKLSIIRADNKYRIKMLD